MNVCKLGLSIAMLLSGGMAIAQGTVDDYNRAYALREKFSANKVFYSNVTPQWIEGTHQFWYVRNTPEGRIYVSVNADKKSRKELFDHKRLTSALSNASGKEVNPEAIQLERLRVNPSLDTLRFVFGNQRWMYATRKNQLVNEGSLPDRNAPQKHWMERDDEKEAAPVTSPDGKYTAYIKNQNVYVKELATGKEKQLSLDGTLSNYYSVYIRWSPDSKKVASCKIRPVEKRYVYYVESSPTDQLQPKLHKQEYAKPGDELPFKIPCIYEVETGRGIIPSTDLFNRQYEIYGPEWNNDSRAVTFEYNQRGHQAYRVLELSAETGVVRPLIEETSDKYVNYTRRFRHDLRDNKHIIWMSERDNWNHLYMYDRTTAQPIHQITRGEWYVREVLRVDEDNRQIYFSANGVQPGEDPYLIRYYRIGFDGKDLVCLTPEEGCRLCRRLGHRCRAAGAGAGHQPGRPAGQSKTETEAVKIKRYSMENAKVPVISAKNLNLWYGDFKALKHISLDVGEREITALIGPSGCGKSTFLKTLNRMNDLVPGVRIEGDVRLKGQDIFARDMELTDLRRRVGMVFQKANPFPMSIYDNITYGPRLHGVRNKAELDELVESSLRGAALWDEVKDRLKKSALGLSGGQQQRLCIARALAVKPEVLLMDEPTSALDPGSTMKVEELMSALKKNYTVVIVTHNMQQAARISDRTAFFLLGELVEVGPTNQIFSAPQDKRTEDYISGRFG